METNFPVRALLEGAYAQTPTLPGFFVKFDDFRTRFNNLVAQHCESAVDVEKILSDHYSDAKFEPNYTPQDSDDVFLAFRIPPQKLKYISELKKKIENVFSSTTLDSEGWMPFAVMGMKIQKPEYQSLGFISIRQTVECLFGKRVEFRTGDISKHEAPVQVRDLKMIGKEVKVFSIPTRIPEKNLKPKQGSYLGDALDNFAYFPRSKDNPSIKGWDTAVNYLATNVALEERWYYDDEDKQNRPILKNYLSYTFERLRYEDELEQERVKREGGKPKLKILENSKFAVWNTGLVDSIYDPIYAYFKRNDEMKNPYITQPWVFCAFATANSSQQKIMSEFPYKPERASYFNDPRELLYDSRANEPTLDWDHFLKDNISRLPVGFVKKGYSSNFDFIEDTSILSKSQRDAYYRKMAEAIYSDDDWKLFLTTRFRNAVQVALARVAWNYKTAIPVYYPYEKKLQLLLPLALEDKKRIDVALVCNHKYIPKEGDNNFEVNNYEGRTIFTLEMAYNNARLITRPDSDWLMADMCVAK